MEKLVKVSTEKNGLNPLICVSPPSYSYQCALKCSEINLQTLQDKDLILLIENNIRGGIPSVFADRYNKSAEIKKIIYMVATNLYGHSMSQMLPYDENEMWHGHPDLYRINIQENLKTPDDADVG